MFTSSGPRLGGQELVGRVQRTVSSRPNWDGHQLLNTGSTRGVLLHHRQLLILGQPGRQHHPASRPELLQQGRRHQLSRGRDAENISKSYVCRILRLALLAPDIIDPILSGRTDQALMLERLERPLPASWEEQRRS